jgi:SAM-dependent methyltransferase
MIGSFGSFGSFGSLGSLGSLGSFGRAAPKPRGGEGGVGKKSTSISVEPSAWLTGHRHLLPSGGRALDVACGRGRHAFWLAAERFDVVAVDVDRDAVDFVNAEARQRGLSVTAEERDLEVGDPALGIRLYDLIVVFNYLHRPLFPFLVAALRPSGVLVYETFTRQQAFIGRPTNPDFLLESGELEQLVAPLRILVAREGQYDGRFIASVVAKR